MHASKRTSRPLTVSDRRIFYATRQVNFLVSWKKLVNLMDLRITPMNQALGDVMQELLTELLAAVPVSPAASSRAHHSPVYSPSKTQSDIDHIAEQLIQDLDLSFD